MNSDPPELAIEAPALKLEAERPPVAPVGRRWRLWPWVLLSCLCIAVLGVGYVVVALRQEPDFYRQTRTELADPVVRRAAVQQLNAQTESLRTAVERDESWQLEFTEQQLNAWLLEELPRHQDQPELQVVTEPLVDLAEGLVRLAARINTEAYHGIVTVEVRPQLVDDDQLQVELVSVRAGALPVPAGRWITRFKELLERERAPVQIVGESPLRVRFSLPETSRLWQELRFTNLQIAADRVTVSGTPRRTEQPPTDEVLPDH